MSTHANMVKMTVSSVSATPSTGKGDITLNAASTGFQSFADAYGANATVDILITKGAEWEVARNCTYTHSGTTLTRGTWEDSSNGTGAIVADNTAVVSVVATAHMGNVTDLSTRGVIQGLEITYSSTTAIAVAAGTCAINGKLLTYAGGTLTSGTTLKDIANSTVTIGASKRYHVFAYDNSGTLEIRVEERDGTGDGAAPVWDSAYDYYKGATTGAAARRIGAFWTNGSSQVMAMASVGSGRMRGYALAAKDPLVYINYVGTANARTGITMTPWSDPADQSLTLSFTLNNSTGSTGPIYAMLSTDNATDHAYLAAYMPNGEYIGLGYLLMVRPTALYYLTPNTNNKPFIGFLGAEMYV